MILAYIARQKRLILVAGMLLIVATAALLWLRPRALALYHQVRGGSILAGVLQTLQKTDPASFACQLGPLVDASTHRKLQQAIAHLEASHKSDARLAQTDLLLGRAYCLDGQMENAINAYRAYTRLRPSNPLGHLELGLAYALNSQKAAVAEWQMAGVTPQQVLSTADQAFNRTGYLSAAYWYRAYAANVDEVPTAVLLRWAMAASVSGLPLPESASQSLPAFPIAAQGKTQIEAKYFRWLREIASYHVSYGDRLVDHPGSDPSIATMWWSGDAVIIIHVPESGKYGITINAQNTLPPPVQMNLAIDLAPVYPFEMDRGDMSWQEFQHTVVLSAGFHVVGLRYLNNAIVNGKDRDAVIDWIELQKVE